MTEVLRIKVGVLVTLVLQGAALVYFFAKLQITTEKDIHYLSGRITTLEAAVADVNRSRWTAREHDRYAAGVERRLTLLESRQ